jgi:hypothetical protein
MMRRLCVLAGLIGLLAVPAPVGAQCRRAEVRAERIARQAERLVARAERRAEQAWRQAARRIARAEALAERQIARAAARVGRLR